MVYIGPGSREEKVWKILIFSKSENGNYQLLAKKKIGD